MMKMSQFASLEDMNMMRRFLARVVNEVSFLITILNECTEKFQMENFKKWMKIIGATGASSSRDRAPAVPISADKHCGRIFTYLPVRSD